MNTQINRDIQREEGHVTVEAEIRVMLPQAKEHQEVQEAARGKEESFLRAFRGSQHLDLRLLS